MQDYDSKSNKNFCSKMGSWEKHPPAEKKESCLDFLYWSDDLYVPLDIGIEEMLF